MATNNSNLVPPRIKDETGNVYGKLTVLNYCGKTSSGDSLWRCECECGAITAVARGDLRKTYGGTHSCGCGRKTQGGGYNMPEYGVWKGMKARCYCPTYREYHLYGGRGITICDRWRQSFQNFLEDMGQRPFPGATIERMDNDAGYSPDNCKWTTMLEQSQNTRKVRLLTYNGETMSLRAWARKLGITHGTLRQRLAKGWPPEKVFSSEHFFVPPPIKKARPR